MGGGGAEFDDDVIFNQALAVFSRCLDANSPQEIGEEKVRNRNPSLSRHSYPPRALSPFPNLLRRTRC